MFARPDEEKVAILCFDTLPQDLYMYIHRAITVVSCDNSVISYQYFNSLHANYMLSDTRCRNRQSKLETLIRCNGSCF